MRYVRTQVSMVVEGKEDESIFTKDERSVRYERIQEIARQTESVLKSMEKCNVV